MLETEAELHPVGIGRELGAGSEVEQLLAHHVERRDTLTTTTGGSTPRGRAEARAAGSQHIDDELVDLHPRWREPPWKIAPAASAAPTGFGSPGLWLNSSGLRNPSNNVIEDEVPLSHLRSIVSLSIEWPRRYTW